MNTHSSFGQSTEINAELQTELQALLALGEPLTAQLEQARTTLQQLTQR